MREEKKILSWPIIVLIIISPFILRPLFGLFTGHNTENIQQRREEHLYEKYGEEFVVDRIGIRSSRGNEFYQARIYPKSIVGSNKERDDYYHASASINKKSFGRLGGVGDSYGLTKINLGAEEYLLAKSKEIFGERIKLKTDVKYRIENSHGFYEWNREANFLKALQRVQENPERKRLELDLDVYIFKRIEDEVEKEERREQIFEFVQYLKEVGLFEYLELGVIFIDERVLAPSFNQFDNEIYFSNKVSEEIDGETVRMPPRELRERMSRELEKEIDKMSEDELLASMGNIRKRDLNYDVLDKYNASHYGLVYSVGILRTKYNSSYNEYKENETIDRYYYKDISDVRVGINLEYAFVE